MFEGFKKVVTKAKDAVVNPGLGKEFEQGVQDFNATLEEIKKENERHEKTMDEIKNQK